LPFINYSNREINCKIVYYGPGLGGKTTNVEYIYENTPENVRGNMIRLATQTERTLYFDFLPLPVGDVRGFKVRFYLYTVPGQVFYYASRKLILKDVDGIVFVADSQADRMESNQASMDSLKSDLREYGYHPEKIPLVYQYNKRDLPNAAPVQDLSHLLNEWQRPEFEAIATTGHGVIETLKAIARQVLREHQRTGR
jgi:hypothetical protein